MQAPTLSDDRIVVSLSDGIGTILFNDQENLNAFDASSARAFSEAANWLNLAEDLRVVMLKSATSVFSVGGNVSAFAEVGDHSDKLLLEMTQWFHSAVSLLMRMDAPVIAVVNGACAGAGASLPCMADIAIAAESSKLKFAYTAIGIAPDGGGTFTLPRIVGLRKAYELMVLNTMLSADEALELGIFNKVVPDDALANEADLLAKTLAAGPTKAFGAVKALLLKSYQQGLESQLADESVQISSLSVTADGQEGIKAFSAKRSPNFRGS